MRRVNLALAILLMLTAGVRVLAQAPPPEPADHRPPPRDAMDPAPPDFDQQGDDDRDDRRRGWRGRDMPMSEDEVREAIEILKRVDPDKAARLEQAVKDNPHDIGKALREHSPYLGRFMAWRRFDPDGFELRIRDMELSRQARECARRLREALKNEDDAIAATERLLLEELVADHFDVRQQIREHELEMLKRRIETLIEQLEARARQRRELIQERLDELIEEKPDDRW